MSDKRNTQYTRKLSVHITPGMNDRLDQLSTLRDVAKAEIVREALRAYLDEQEDVLGSRRHFTKMFQRRVDELERLQVILLMLNVQMGRIIFEKGDRVSYSITEVLDNAIESGVQNEDAIHQRVRTGKPLAR